MAKKASTKYTSVMLCMALALWLCTCKGSPTESPPGNNPETELVPVKIPQSEPVANTDHELERTMDEGYGSYSLVPAGTFTMGDDYDEGNPRKKPVHRVYLEAYYIGEFEITNREYSRFMADGGGV